METTLEKVAGFVKRHFWPRENYLQTSNGATSKGLPIVLNRDGLVDQTMLSGAALAEYVADTVGAMVVGNTETDIAVTYDDADNTLDFVIDRTTLKTYLDTFYLPINEAYKVAPFNTVTLGSGQTWTIDVTMAAVRNLAIVDINLTVGTNSVNVWGILTKRVTFQMGTSVGANAVILTTTDFGTASGSSITIVGPTAIANGIRFTVAASAATTAAWNQALVRVVGRPSNLVISSAVA